jgi:hypothetical protein
MSKATGRTYGRGSIFTGKVKGDSRYRKQGLLTHVGLEKFDAAVARLKALYHEIMGHPREAVSDGDVFEFGARGEANTRAYLRAKKKQQDEA